MRTCIQNVTLLPGATGERHLTFIPEAEIQIDGNTIVYAGRAQDAPAFEAEKRIDGRGMVAMPGLCNMHTHTPMTVMRNHGSDLSLSRWLNEKVYPMEKHLTDDCVKACTDLGIMEMLRFGTTSFNDMYMHMDAMVQSLLGSGMRAMLSYCVVDFDQSCNDLKPGVDFVEKWQNKSELMRVGIAPHSEVTTTVKVLELIKKYADEKQIPIHIHISETQSDREGSLQRRGLTPPWFFEKLGMLTDTTIAAHCVWMDDDEIALFAKRGVTIVHNPVSNLKLASGIAPIEKMLKAGCKITLGTDGVASNNNLNLWEEMKLMPLLQKGTTLDPTVVTPAQTIEAATLNGARALGYPNLGLLKQGYLADLILVDVDNEHTCPVNDLEAALIYSVLGTDVKLTMVNGKVLYQDGEYTTLQPKLVMERAKKESEKTFELTMRADAEKK